MVAEHYATIEYCNIPIEVDGICLNLKRRGTRPTIIMNRDRPLRRRQFTLAHELGHVLIPWHQGSLYDDFSVFDSDGGLDRLEMEAEANRFASELLMPSSWILEVLQSSWDFGAAISVIQDKAEVSTIASAIRPMWLAGPNHIFAYCDASSGIVLDAGRVTGLREQRH
jgi:Zn-dependent peptidase ImmA (M78 family)